MNLTPWDVQSKQVFTTDGVAPTLWSGESCWGGGTVFILTAEEHDETEKHDHDNRHSCV